MSQDDAYFHIHQNDPDTAVKAKVLARLRRHLLSVRRCCCSAALYIFIVLKPSSSNFHFHLNQGQFACQGINVSWAFSSSARCSKLRNCWSCGADAAFRWYASTNSEEHAHYWINREMSKMCWCEHVGEFVIIFRTKNFCNVVDELRFGFCIF